MMVRLWSCRAPLEKASGYVDFFREKIVPQLRGIGGHRGATVLQRPLEGEVEILVLTRWDSMDAIRAFAGDEPTRAVVEDEAKTFLKEYDSRVKHFDVVLEAGD